MIRAGRTIAVIVLACLVAGDPAVASTWDQALVTSLIDQGRDAEAIALCDAAIDLAHAPGGVEDLDILSAGRDAASTKYGILRRTKAAIPEIIDALDAALSFEVTMEWHGLIEIMPGEPKFGPEWIPVERDSNCSSSPPRRAMPDDATISPWAACSFSSMPSRIAGGDPSIIPGHPISSTTRTTRSPRHGRWWMRGAAGTS